MKKEKRGIDEWQDVLKVSKSLRTAELYAWHLRALVAAAPARAPGAWRQAQLAAYLADRRAAGWSPSHLKTCVCALRSFYAFAVGRASSPAQSIPYPKINRKRPRCLNEAQLLNVLASCDTSHRAGIRDIAILCLMLDSGLRASEVCRLKLADVDLAGRRLKVLIKGGDEGAGVFSVQTAAYLYHWLAQRKQIAAPAADTFFVSLTNAGRGLGVGKPLTAHGLRALFKRIAKRAGLEAFSPHDLRRSFATVAIRNGAPTRIVQVAGRWNNIEMVERYTPDIEAADFDIYSPVASVLKNDSGLFGQRLLVSREVHNETD